MSDPFLFAEVLGHFVQRSMYTRGQLASLTTLPKTTIANWLEGRVKRPRYWQGVVELAVAMRLTELEANQLLSAARHPSIQELKLNISNESEKSLLGFWQTAVAPTPFQAIPLPPYFVGREAEQMELEKYLRAETHTAVYCLHGMAGVGKTSLAARLAYQVRDHFADGVLWARLDSSDSMSILATFADAYQRDVTQYHDVASRSRVVRDLLTNKQTLLVLDNAQSSKQIEPLLPTTGRCAVLITTRRQDLAILAGAKWFTVRPFTRNAPNALTLFSKILSEERVQAEKEYLAQIADELGHLPLALVIAACRLAYEPGWQIETFLTRLQQEQKRLQALHFESQDVQRSFQLSYDRLNPAAQQTFRAAGALGKQDFAVAPITALTELDLEDVEDNLRQLVTLSLLQSVANGRFQLHPLLHDFAQSFPATNEGADRLINYWQKVITTNKYRFVTLKQEFGHIEIALNSAIQTKRVNTLSLILENLMPFFITQGAYEQAAHYLTQAETAVAPTENNAAKAKIQLLLGQLERHRHNLDTAEQYLQTGLALIQAAQDSVQQAQFLAELGIVQNCRGQLAQGKNYLTKALLLAKQDSIDTDLLLNILTELGELAFMENEDALAEKYYREGLALAMSHENKTHAIMLLKSLGAMHHLEGKRIEAKQLFNQGRTLAQEIGYRKGLMAIHNNLGVLAFLDGDWLSAEHHLQTALDEAERLHDVQGMGMLFNNLAKFMRHNVRFAEAQSYFEKAFNLAQTKNEQETCVAMQKELGILAAQQGDRETAVFHFSTALSLAKNLPIRWEAEVLLAWGTADLLQGDASAGQSRFSRLQKIQEENNMPQFFREKFELGLMQIEDVKNGCNPTITFPPEHLKVFI